MDQLSELYGKTNLEVAGALRTPGAQALIVHLARTMEGENELLRAISNATIKKDEATANFLIDSIPPTKFLLYQIISNLCITGGHYNIIKRLVLSKKISPDYRIHEKPLILYVLGRYISESDQLKVVTFLLDAGADVNAVQESIINGKKVLLTILDRVSETWQEVQ